MKRFQHFKNRRPPWIKLHHEILDDLDINTISSDAFKFLIQIWLIASEDPLLDGKLPTPEAIAFKLRLSKSRCYDLLKQVDIFLISDCHQDDITLSTVERRPVEKSREEESRTKQSTSALSPAEFILKLKTIPAYGHIDIDAELGRMDGWLLAHPGRKKSKAFITNWLNKIEKPIPPSSVAMVKRQVVV